MEIVRDRRCRHVAEHGDLVRAADGGDGTDWDRAMDPGPHQQQGAGGNHFVGGTNVADVALRGRPHICARPHHGSAGAGRSFTLDGTSASSPSAHGRTVDRVSDPIGDRSQRANGEPTGGGILGAPVLHLSRKFLAANQGRTGEDSPVQQPGPRSDGGGAAAVPSQLPLSGKTPGAARRQETPEDGRGDHDSVGGRDGQAGGLPVQDL
uniref:Uncharacterized protein n=1 Tax=Spongospora subterranea TaxID=70186 RepID=A0A0H5QPQ8_9EUKA|eukprot:CRZ04028.1 hypothetical protein [Spongospora subterranea]